MKKSLFFGFVFLILIVLTPFVRSANYYTTPIKQVAPYLSAHVINDSSVVGYWRFEKPSNATFTNDYLGLNNGTVSNATLTEQGIVGSGYIFNGINSSITLPYFSAMDVTDNLSVFVWEKLTSPCNNANPANDNEIVTRGNAPYPWLMGFARDATPRLNCSLSVYVKGAWSDTLNTTPTDGNWHNIGFVSNGSNLSVFIDGDKVFTANTGAGNLATSSGFGIFMGKRDSGKFFNGSLDELMIFNKSLTPTDIKNIFQAGNATRILTRNNLGVSVVNASNYSRVVYDWMQNNISLAVLNMPFEPDHIALETGTDGQLLYFPFENESNSTFMANLAPYGNATNSTHLSGATPVITPNGRVGSGLLFDGVNQNSTVINTSATINLSATQNFTLEMWAMSNTSGPETYAFDRTQNTNGVLQIFRSNGGNNISCRIRGDNAIGLTIVTYNGFTANAWHHVACVRDSALDNLSIYVDGVMRNSTTDATTAAISGLNYLIGDVTTGLEGWNGTIDELMLWNRTLTAAEITAHYNQGNNVRDFSTFGNNGTLFNTTAESPYWNLTGGKIGGGMEFNTKTNISMTQPSLNITKNFSVEVWINPKTNGLIANYIISKFVGASPGWGLGFVGSSAACSNARGELFVYNGTDLSCSGVVMNNNTWYHVAFTNNGTVTILYVNGAAKNTTAMGFTAITNALLIGAREGCVCGFNGTMDEVRIYNRTLSADEIFSHYQQAYTDLRDPETMKSQNYSVAVTLGNDYSFNDTLTSNVAYINNTPPYLTSPPTINSTYGYNGTHENLTCYGGTAVDDDSDNVTILYDWRVGNISDAVLNMPMDGGNSTFVPDMSSFGNNGTNMVNVTWNSTGGYNGKGAYEFGGVRNFINGSLSGSPVRRQFSIIAWVKLKNLGVQQNFLGIGATNQQRAVPYVSSANVLRCFTANSTTNVDLSSGIIISANTWYHYACTEDGNNLSIYVNGVLRATTVTNMTVNDTNQFIMGIDVNAIATPTNGTIDEVRIYNRSLSAPEILALYNNRTDLLHSNASIRSRNYTCVATPSDGEILNNGIGAPNAIGPSNSSSNLKTILGCGQVDSSNVMEGDIYSPGSTCFNLTAINTQFSCAGFHLFGNTAAFGIWTNSSNVSIANCLISNFSTGIVFNNAHNSSIFNSTIRNNNNSQIWLQNTTDATIYSFNRSNGLTTNITGGTMGLFLDNSSMNKIYDTLFSTSQIAVRLVGGINNTFINGSVTGAGNSTFFSTSSQDNLIYNMTAAYNLHSLADSSKVLELLFENGTNDTSGLANNGILNGATNTTGIIGKAYHFDGSGNTYILTSSNASIPTGASPSSISAWFKLDNLTGGTLQIIAGYGATSGSADITYLTVFNNQLYYWGSSTDCPGSTILTNNQWYYGVITYDGLVERVYLNGNLEASCTKSLNVQLSNVLIGKSNYTGQIKFFNGTIDEVTIYNKTLESREIKQQYALTRPLFNQFNITTGSNATITNSTVFESNISTDSNSWMWIRWYLNVSVYANNQSSTPIGPATLNVTSEDPRILYSLGPNNSTEIMVRESIWNFSTTQLNWTTNITANSSLGYLNNYTEKLALQSQNLTITLSAMTAPPVSGTGGSAGHTGECNAAAGMFTINGTCQPCPGGVVDKGGGVYSCVICDEGTHFDSEKKYCIDDVTLPALTSPLKESRIFAKLNKESMGGLLAIVLFIIVSIALHYKEINKKKMPKKIKTKEEKGDGFGSDDK